MNVWISEDDMCTTQKLNLARVQKWLERNGHTIVDSISDADKAICMTCNGWSKLEDASYTRIRELKSHVPTEDLIVMGCVVDAHFASVIEIHGGPTVRTRSDSALSFEEIEQYIPAPHVRLADVESQSFLRRKSDYRDFNPRRHFINISEGCAFNCSFCTHKPGLGPRRSRSLDSILQQVHSAIENDAEIVHLMGMETALWGTEIDRTYPQLLEEILRLGGNFEIHVAQFQPHGFKLYGRELAETLSNRRVTDIQVPIQTTSDRLMKMMNRKNHSTLMADHLQYIRDNNPRAVLRTDVIVGWPTETRAELVESLDYAARFFDEVAVYAIELSPDLPAFKYKDQEFSKFELDEIQKFSRDFLVSRGVVVHSGQQDDPTMKIAEAKRIQLRLRKAGKND